MELNSVHMIARQSRYHYSKTYEFFSKFGILIYLFSSEYFRTQKLFRNFKSNINWTKDLIGKRNQFHKLSSFTYDFLSLLINSLPICFPDSSSNYYLGIQTFTKLGHRFYQVPPEFHFLLEITAKDTPGALIKCFSGS